MEQDGRADEEGGRASLTHSLGSKAEGRRRSNCLGSPAAEENETKNSLAARPKTNSLERKDLERAGLTEEVRALVPLIGGRGNFRKMSCTN